MSEARRKYNAHKAGAKTRGVEFDLTFEEWSAIWGAHMQNRGRGKDQLGMLRSRDQGGYQVGNIRLGTPKENMQEMGVEARVKSAQIAWVADRDHRPMPPTTTSWMVGRNRVFDEYSEEDDTNI